MEIKVTDIKPSKYNPRKMKDETKEALKVSMTEFSDISGITWNKTTGNIITGHHRWQGLIDLHGKENLKFKQITDDIYAILDKKKKKNTGFTLKVVEWDATKEKAANVTANNPKLQGVFTDDINLILEELNEDLDKDLFAGLKLDFDFGDLIPISIGNAESDEEWESDIKEVENTKSNLDGIPVIIKIKCSQQDKDKVITLINDAISNNKFFSTIEVM